MEKAHSITLDLHFLVFGLLVYAILLFNNDHYHLKRIQASKSP